MAHMLHALLRPSVAEIRNAKGDSAVSGKTSTPCDFRVMQVSDEFLAPQDVAELTADDVGQAVVSYIRRDLIFVAAS